MITVNILGSWKLIIRLVSNLFYIWKERRTKPFSLVNNCFTNLWKCNSKSLFCLPVSLCQLQLKSKMGCGGSKPTRVTSINNNTEEKPITEVPLTGRQIKLVQESWKHVTPDLQTHGIVFFTRYLNEFPNRLFNFVSCTLFCASCLQLWQTSLAEPFFSFCTETLHDLTDKSTLSTELSKGLVLYIQQVVY